MAKIAVVRVRGSIKLNESIKDTLNMMRLYDKNYCVVLEDTQPNKGMIKKVKDYVAYGEIDDATFNELIAKRGEEYTGKIKDKSGKIDYSRRFFEINGKRYKKSFRLCPPRGGYEWKGTKRPFSRGGALGYRGKNINALIKRMI
jgi:large subunit ribosomal protein L30